MSLWIRAAAAASFVTMGVVACGATGSVTVTKGERLCILYYGGGGIPDPPKGAALCAAGTCNYQTQTGCAASETCYPDIDATKKTVTPACRISGTQKTDASCDATHQCDKGSFCVDGACRKLCCGGDWSACPTGESCIRQAEAKYDETTTVYAGVDLCFPVNTCDVFDPNACKTEQRTCRVVDPTGAVACAPFSALVAGDTCDRDHQCGAGLTCANATPADPTHGTCRRLCRWDGSCGDPSCSDSDGPCVHFDRDPRGAGECTPGWVGTPIVADGGVLKLDGGAL